MYAFYCILPAASPLRHYISHHAWNYIWKMRKSWVCHVVLIGAEKQRSHFADNTFMYLQSDFSNPRQQPLHYPICRNLWMHRNHNELLKKKPIENASYSTRFVVGKPLHPANTHYLFWNPTVGIPGRTPEQGNDKLSRLSLANLISSTSQIGERRDSRHRDFSTRVPILYFDYTGGFSFLELWFFLLNIHYIQRRY